MKPHSLRFYRDSEQSEIDFLVNTGNKTLALECKWHEIPSNHDALSIFNFMEYVKKKSVPELGSISGNVICRTPHTHPLKEHISGINLEELSKKLLLP